MAFKFTVDYQQLRLIIQTDSTESVNLFQHLKSTVDFTDIKQIVAFQQLTAANVKLDSDSKNLYFIVGHPNAETISLTDAPALLFATTKTETLTLSEEAVKTVNKGFAETATLAEELSRVVDYVRAFTETPTLTDAPALSLTTSKSDTFSIGDSPSLGIEPAKSDTLSFSDEETLAINPAKSETLTVSDAPAFSLSVPHSETATVSEAKALSVDKPIPAGGTVTYTVTVASATNSYGSGNKYHIDGVNSPALTLDVGKTYRFDLSDSSVSGHPLRFSETANGSHGGGSAYSTNVTVNGTPGSSGAYVEIQVTGSTPGSLHYYCTNHSGMGGSITVQNAETVAISEVFSRVVTFSRSFADSYALDDVASPSDDLRTDVDISKGNVVSVGDSAPTFAFTTGFSDAPTISDSPSIEFVTSFADSVTMSEILVSGAGNIYTDTTSISESLAHSLGKSLSDSATITESISVVLVSGSNSVLNTSALNTSVLN